MIVKKGIIFNVERYAIHDGPGIRTTLFFKGCRLRCWWCHNPEGQNLMPELTYRQSRCIGCGKCAMVCSRKTLTLTNGLPALNRQNCNACGTCANICPSEALLIAGREVSVEEVTEEIERDIAFYEESEGGVTFSGGEPLTQPEFLNAVLDECSERDIHTTLDTNGYASQKTIDRVRDKIDLLICDIKTMNDGVHRKYTGVSNKPILRNLQRLAENGSNVAISMPIIPHINDDEKNIVKTGEFVSSLPGIRYISLLPYHKVGIDKYKTLGKSYKLEDTCSPSSQGINRIKKALEAFGLNVKIGGR